MTRRVFTTCVVLIGMLCLGSLFSTVVWAQKATEKKLEFPPQLPEGKLLVTDSSAKFLQSPIDLPAEVSIAKQAPTVDFLYYPEQNYLGNPWSNWGDSLALNGKYYSAIGDHLAANSKDLSHGTGTAFVFEYNADTKQIRTLVNAAEFLQLPVGHYTPGKIHSRIDMGSDGNLYFSTHRGSTKVTTSAYHYQGDWVLRCNPITGKSEVVVQAPVAKHCIPNSVLDPQRLIFYGGTAPGEGTENSGIQFFAYDIQQKKLLYAGENGPARYMIFASSSGKVYYVPGAGTGQLVKYDPQLNTAPKPIADTTVIGLRAATQETKQHKVYAVSSGQGGQDAQIWEFDTQTEKIRILGSAAIGSQQYIASIDVDPSGRYLYYAPGAHGGSERDGTPIIQYDTQTNSRKVLAFLHPFYQETYGFTLKGTYATALDSQGDKLYITWNVSRGSKAWDCCGLTVIHIPESERIP